MHSRRTYLALGATAIATASAGCLDQLPFIGDGPVEFGADPASVPTAVLDETGYEEHELQALTIDRTFEVAGQSQEVVVTNWQAEYDKAIDLGGLGLVDERLRAAVFTALSTPQVSVLGRTFNPVAEMDPDELAAMVQDRYDGLDDLERVGQETWEVAGESASVTEFEGDADLIGAGISLDLTLHISEAVESGDDLLLGIGGYPTLAKDDERPNIEALFAAIEHP